MLMLFIYILPQNYEGNMENYIYLHNSFISNPYNGGVTYIDV